MILLDLGGGLLSEVAGKGGPGAEEDVGGVEGVVGYGGGEGLEGGGGGDEVGGDVVDALGGRGTSGLEASHAVSNRMTRCFLEPVCTTLRHTP